MNRTFFFSAALVMALSGFLNNAISSPKLECAEAEYNFGTVDGESPVSHTFQIRNAGTSELVIRKIHAPCGCTSFLLSNKSLSPGETLPIPVTVSLSGRKGVQEKGVFLETNDASLPILNLTLRGVVGSGIEVQPPILTIRKSPKSSEVFGEVTVRALGKKPLVCLEAKPKEGKVVAGFKPLDDGEGFVLRATPAANLPPGQHREKIRLRLQGSSQKDMTLDVQILLPAEFIAAPSILRLDTKAPAPLSRSIILRSPAGNAFTVGSVEVPVETMTTRIEWMDATSTRVVIGNIEPARELDGKKLLFRIGGAKPQTIEVPLSVPR